MVFGSGSTGGAEAQYEINRSGTQVAYTGFAASNEWTNLYFWFR
jgi:hypothetical protein